jgi:hypothetical protein
MNFRALGYLTHDDAYQMIRFNNLRDRYRVFAIPKTILTKGSSDAVGKWLADELKKGSELYGNLLRRELLDEGELLGLTTEWTDWISHESKRSTSIPKDTYFYRRCGYMNSLVSLIFPEFDLATLLAKPTHRTRGKKYNRKRRNE